MKPKREPLDPKCAGCEAMDFTKKGRGGLIVVAAILGLLSIAGPAWLDSRMQMTVRNEFDRRFPATKMVGQETTSAHVIGVAQAASR